MSDDFDLAHDKLTDQPVTIGGDKSAAAWHPNRGPDVPRAVYESLLDQRDRYVRRYVALVDVERERDDARAERDALAHVIEQAPHTPGCQINGLWILPVRGPVAVQQSGKCTCWKSTAPAVSLALRDAEVFDQGANAVADHMWDGDGGGIVNPYRAAAIREEAN